MIKPSIPDNYRKLTPVIFAVLLAALPFTAFSQTSEQQLADSLQQARTSLQQLDNLANVCLDASGGSEACSEFQHAVDGELLAAYLENCAVAKSWREEFVTSQSQETGATSTRSEELLKFLVDVEFLCGENALARATDNVFPAYRLTRSTQTDGSSLARSLQYQLDSARQNSLIDRQRSNLSQGVSSQSERSRRQVRRQFDQLELELLRQQNDQQFPRQ